MDACARAAAFMLQAQALLMSGVPVLSSAAGAAPPGAASRPFGGGDGGGSAGAAGPGDGVRGVVPAARFAERMLRDVSAWSLAMPTFEGSFMGACARAVGRREERGQTPSVARLITRDGSCAHASGMEGRSCAAWVEAAGALRCCAGVAENILGRILDSFWLTLSSLAAGHRAFHLALRYDVALAQVGG